MDKDKNFVALEKCVLCGNDTGNLLMTTRLDKGFSEKYASTSNSVCKDCRKKYLEKGVMIFSDSGDIMVVTEEAFKKIFSKDFPKERIAKVNQSLIDQLKVHLK